MKKIYVFECTDTNVSPVMIGSMKHKHGIWNQAHKVQKLLLKYCQVDVILRSVFKGLMDYFDVAYDYGVIL
jgi:hypothetical protein